MRKYIPYILSTCIIICFFLLTEKSFSQTSQNSDGTFTYVKGITSGRAKALATVALGLISLLLAWRAKIRFTKNNSNRNGLVTAFILSLLTIILSAVHLSTSAGAEFGSGSGKAGAIMAVLLGLAGAALSGLALRKK